MYMETLTLENSKALNGRDLINIYEQYNEALFRYAYRLLGDQDTAEECVAETFSRFLASLGRKPEGPENVQAYLYRIAHNWITDYYRRQPPPQVTLDAEQRADPDNNPVKLVAKSIEKERVRNALLRLSPEQQQVIVLRFLEEKSHEEVAMAMDKTVEATRALQYRALSTLKRMLLEKNGNKNEQS